jgi:hypothetical protein
MQRNMQAKLLGNIFYALIFYSDFLNCFRSKKIRVCSLNMLIILVWILM